MYNKLLLIKKDMSSHHRSKEYLERYYINKRLKDSLNSYYKDLEDSIKYLHNRKPENILKKLGE